MLLNKFIYTTVFVHSACLREIEELTILQYV